MPPVIRIDRLTCRFGETVAVDDLSLEVGAGEVFGLLGHNGAGKTTTVRAVNGVVEPHSGEVRVFALDPLSDGAALRARTAVVTESSTLDERLTGRETLRIFAQLYGIDSAPADRRARSLLDDFGLGGRGDERVGGYSKGMRQRLALARALVHEPEILFLDEPTAGLDPVASRQLHALVREWSRELSRTVVMCTHNLAEAQALCDRVAVLAKGRLLVAGTPAELAARLPARRELRVVVASGQLDTALRIAAARTDAEARVDGTDTLVVRGVAGDGVPELAEALVHGGVRLHALVPVEPSLADVYFALQPELAELPGADGAAGTVGEAS